MNVCHMCHPYEDTFQLKFSGIPPIPFKRIRSPSCLLSREDLLITNPYRRVQMYNLLLQMIKQ